MTTPRLGFGLPVTGTWARRANMVRLAERAERLGYASLWTFQRLLHPADGDWGPQYRSVHDPIVVLAYAAAVTERARLGIGIVNAPFYAPIVLAKQLTTLDEVSAGRLDVGLGLGWAAEEFAAAGVPYARRGARFEEFVRCLYQIWADDPVRFDGSWYQVPPALVDPKPVQRPHPPVLFGGSAAPSLRRAGRLADGWISSSRQDLTRIGEDIATVREAAAEAGRDPTTLRFVVRGVVHLGTALEQHGRRQPLTGSAEQIRGDLGELGRYGATEVFWDLNFDRVTGTPDADPAASMRRAEQVLETLAPRAA